MTAKQKNPKPTEEKQSTQLTAPERAAVALGSSKLEVDLLALAKAATEIVTITNKDGYEQAQATRMTLLKARTSITKTGKEARDDAQAFAKAVIAEEKRLIAIVQSEEERIEKLQAEWDAAREAEKQAKIQAEAERQAELMRRVEAIEPGLTYGDTSANIEQRIATIEAIVVDDTFGEYLTIASNRKEAALTALRAALEGARSAERAAEEARVQAEAQKAENARLEAERAELARQRAELEAQAAKIAEAQQAQREAEAAKVRAEQEQARAAEEAERKRQQAEIEAEAAKVAEERRAIEAEKARIAKEQAEAERIERERIEAEQRAAEEAAKAPDREKLAEFSNQVYAMRAKVPIMSTPEGEKVAVGIQDAIVKLTERIATAAANL